MQTQFSVTADKRSFSIFAYGEKWFTCPAACAVDTTEASDQDDRFLEVHAFEQEQTEHGVRYIWRTFSNLWVKKEYVLEVSSNAARFFIRVEGSGMVERIRWFLDRAEYEAAGYYLPIANHGDLPENRHMIREPGVIELGYFTPPCYVYPFFMAGCGGMLGVGLAAKPGQYNFDQFRYTNHNDNGCGFELPLYGKTKASGVWESQSLIFVPGSDPYDVVHAYAEWHYQNGWCRKKDRSCEPSWWKRPIFCGWGEQGALKKKYGGEQRDYASQKDYTEMSRLLDSYDLHPGCIVIDDKWQEAFGTAVPDTKKWPDLRAFTDAEHRKGRRVLLWFRSWHPEGLTDDECISYLCTACASDPTSAVYRERLERNIRYLLSDEDGCCGCDGFKIDFANCMPLGKYVSCHEDGVFGVELLRRYLVMLHDFAKSAKPDALINCSCAHPYFDEITDQLRIHDYWGTLRNAPEVMEHRAMLGKAAMDGVLIDTDAGGTGSHRDFVRWIKKQPEIGVPNLYYLTSNASVPFDNDDIALIRDCWTSYENRLENENGRS